MMKKYSLLFLVIILLAVGRLQANNLDAEMPVRLLNDSTVVFDNKVYPLGPGQLYLDGSMTQPAGKYAFNDVLKALDAVDKSMEKSVTLLVAPWVYWLDDPDDPEVRRNKNNSNGVPFAVEVSCDTLNIVGMASRPENIVFAVNRGQTQGALGNFTMFHFRGKSLELSDMTFGNYCNVDLCYPLRPEFNRVKRRDAIVQAQIGICENTDRLYARDCRFISRLNMCPFVGARRSLYKNCYMECTDDALSGSAVYLDCAFRWFSTKPFYNTSRTGAVFLNCDIELLGGTPQYITKMPGAVTMIDTRFHTGLIRDRRRPMIRWTRDMSATVCYQSNVVVDGRGYGIDAERPQLSIDITGKRLLEAYKVECNGNVVYNIPNLLGGDDGWDPLGLRKKIEALQEQMGKPLLDLPVYARLNDGCIEMGASGDRRAIGVEYRRWGDYPATSPVEMGECRWSYPGEIKLYTGKDGGVFCETGNTRPTHIKGALTVDNDYGLRGVADISIAPYLKPAPEFVDEPMLTYDKKHGIVLSYSLAGITNDDSFVAWYRRDSDGDTVRIRHGRVPQLLSYEPTQADKGCGILAMLVPKGDDTRSGESRLVEFKGMVAGRHISNGSTEHELSTDFADIPVHYQPKVRKGWWTFDAHKPLDTSGHDWTAEPENGWYYGYGTDGATGIGLVQKTKGARLFYTPFRDKCRDMSLKLELEPCKPAGQGFGSATGQYMDIYMKFDPITLSGYALRIERTADYDRAVVFSLVSYDKGIVTRICEPVASSCYRTPCEVELSIIDGLFTAKARTSTAVEPRDGVAESVSLSVSVPDNDFSAFGIQHTGSTGASATLISRLHASWK